MKTPIENHIQNLLEELDKQDREMRYSVTITGKNVMVMEYMKYTDGNVSPWIPNLVHTFEDLDMAYSWLWHRWNSL